MLALVAALILSLLSVVAPVAANADEGAARSISGVVSLPEGADEALLADVRVSATAVNSDSSNAASAATPAADGTYALEGLAAEAYNVSFEVTGAAAESLEGQAFGVTEEFPEGQVVDLAAGDRADVNASLVAAVVAESVEAEVVAPAEEVAAEGAAPEEAIVEEVPEEEAAARDQAATTADGTTAPALAPAEIAYPGDRNVDPNAPVLVGEVPDVAGTPVAASVDAPLVEDTVVGAAATGNRTISGKVTLDGGNYSKVQVYLENVDSKNGTPSRFLNFNSSSVPAAKRDTYNKSTGAFQFKNLAPGRYRISFEYWADSPVLVDRWYPNALDHSGAKAVDIRKANATGINGSLKKGVALKGAFSAPAGVNKSTSSLYAVSKSGQAWRLYWDKTANTYESGAMPVGDYWLLLEGLDAKYKLASMQFVKAGSTTKFTPNAGSILTRNVKGVNPTAKITGTIGIAGGLPKDFKRAANVSQVIDGVDMSLYYSSMNYTGNYLSIGLAPGKYVVEFSAVTGRDVAKGEWYNKKPSRAKADVVTLKSGQNAKGINGTVKTGSSGQVSPFADVKTNHKFYNEIAWMFYSGTSTGVRKGGKAYYQPKNGVSREAMAAFMYRMNAPANYKAPKKSPFKDVSTKHKFYNEISWMYTSGLSTGVRTSNGRMYMPKDRVSREAMAAFMYRQYAKPSQKTYGPSFNDVKKGQKFYKEIQWMYDTGLSTGVRTNYGRSYQPKNTVTREAMAAFLFRNALYN